MTGRRYYITSLADWQRHSTRFANSHWLALGDGTAALSPQRERYLVPLLGEDRAAQMDTRIDGVAACASAPEASSRELPAAKALDPNGVNRILVLIEADEGVHLALEDDAAFEALPHPLAPTSISDTAQSELAAHGVKPGATTFDVAEIVSRTHPLLRHRVF